MKKILSIAVILFTLLSCSSDDSSSRSSDTYIKFTINGTNYNFRDIITAESGAITINGNNGTLTNPGDTQLTLWLPLMLSNGTFDVDDSFENPYQISFDSESLNFEFDFAELGTITITQSTGDYIKGTFTATITNSNDQTINITNGEFKAYSME